MTMYILLSEYENSQWRRQFWLAFNAKRCTNFVSSILAICTKRAHSTHCQSVAIGYGTIVSCKYEFLITMTRLYEYLNIFLQILKGIYSYAMVFKEILIWNSCSSWWFNNNTMPNLSDIYIYFRKSTYFWLTINMSYIY